MLWLKREFLPLSSLSQRCSFHVSYFLDLPSVSIFFRSLPASPMGFQANLPSQYQMVTTNKNHDFSPGREVNAASKTRINAKGTA